MAFALTLDFVFVLLVNKKGSDYLDNALRWKNNENGPFPLFVQLSYL